MRGEDFFARTYGTAKGETPPHAWGRLASVLPHLPSLRNTPTCVGKTIDTLRSLGVEQKHPHMRGEDALKMVRCQPTSETPPHAWGRLASTAMAGTDVGNTPTCVGKTQGRKPRSYASQKHPHMRGEDPRPWRSCGAWWRNTPTCVGKTTNSAMAKLFQSETPPHAWGRRFPLPCTRTRRRNTPTCVGKTTHRCNPSRCRGKHPHMRGEDDPYLPAPLKLAETPPHAWGRRAPAVPVPQPSGNTPTCVGKTTIQRNRTKSTAETPPHAWGRRSRDEDIPARARNTPTCVGKTRPSMTSGFTPWKHPHMRGEDQQERLPEGRGLRNTPTCVGKTGSG